MKHENTLNLEDVVRIKEKRRARRTSDQALAPEGKTGKSRRKKAKKFIFNQNFDFDNLDIYDE